MGSAIQKLETSTSAADTPAEIIRTNIVELPFRKARYQIGQTTRICEVLRQSIDILQQSIRKLEGIIAMINDRETRDNFQQQLSSMNGVLLLKLAQLASMDHKLQAMLRRTHRPRY